MKTHRGKYNFALSSRSEIRTKP